MAIIDLQKPDKVIMNSSDDFFGSFEFRPLEPGYGITVGNALRRVLLNSLQGFAITSVKIEGVDHEFSAIKGIVEDVSQILLNLKIWVKSNKKIWNLKIFNIKNWVRTLKYNLNRFLSELNFYHIISAIEKK
mgnify:CR=1 FL=1